MAFSGIFKRNRLDGKVGICCRQKEGVMVELVLIEENELEGKGAGKNVTMSKEEKYTVRQVAAHSSADDCWLIIHGKVYDVTRYLDDHPGGDQVLLVAAGEDATEEFDEAGHSQDAWKLMEQYLVGQVDQSSTSSKTRSSSRLFYKTLPVLASVLLVGLVVGTVFWRRKRTGHP